MKHNRRFSDYKGKPNIWNEYSSGVNSEIEHVGNNWLLGDVFIEEKIRNFIKQKLETSAIFKLYDLSSNF